MSFLSKWFLGVDLDEEQKRNDELDAFIRQDNMRLLNEGIWNQAQYDGAEINLNNAQQQIGTNGSVTAGVVTEGEAGAKEGLSNLTSGINNVLSTAVGSIFKSIPLSVWILLAIALFVYLGGLVFLRKKISNA